MKILHDNTGIIEVPCKGNTSDRTVGNKPRFEPVFFERRIQLVCVKSPA